MFHLGDMFRRGACALDELFIEGAGRVLIQKETGTQLRGFYEVPPADAISQFGIDSPDEMDVELGYFTTIRKLGRLPQIAEVFVDFSGQYWRVLNRKRKDDVIRGQNRLVLTLVRHVVTMTGGKKDEQHCEGTDGEGSGTSPEVST